MSGARTFKVGDATQSAESEELLSWSCCFCPRVRVYEGGRPGLFEHLDTCPVCGSRVAVEPGDRAALAAMIAKHLL